MADKTYAVMRHIYLILFVAVVTTLCLPLASVFAQSPAPGGFIKKGDSTEVRPRVTPAQIPDFPLQGRGIFTFPAPYNTKGIRITNASDCAGGQDCVLPVGYSYWRNINNHVGSNSMYIFLGLSKARGGNGPTLFSYNKVTDAVVNEWPLFAANDPFSEAGGDGWYFSATQPTTLYVFMIGTAQLKRYDVINKQFVSTAMDLDQCPKPTVCPLDAAYIFQPHSSDDDLVHSATVQQNNTFNPLGCVVYRGNPPPGQASWLYFPQYRADGRFDECQIDKSGHWLATKEDINQPDPTGPSADDTRVINLTNCTPTCAEDFLYDNEGGEGHSDNGYSYMVMIGNALSDTNPNTIRLWDFGQPLDQGPTQGIIEFYRNGGVPHAWDGGAPNHVSHANARSSTSPDQQYVCGSAANYNSSAEPNPVIFPFSNEVVCFRLNSSNDALVVAPVMTDLNASGGGSDPYAKLPKGNLDVTGKYFIWTDNADSNRLDAFIVKVPNECLYRTPQQEGECAPVPPSGPENVAWTNPINVIVTGNSLQENCSGCGNAGAQSSQTITAGDGYVEFTATEPNTMMRAAGLSNGNTDNSCEDIDFAILLQGNGWAEVRENCVFKWNTPYVNGDVFRVAVESGVVKYYKNYQQNPTPFYTSTAPTYPLLVDAGLFGPGSTITNAVIFRAQ